MSHPKLPRFHHKHGKYWHVTFVNGKRNWFDLGADYVEAVKLWSRRENPNFGEEDDKVFEDLVGAYVAEVLPALAKSTQTAYLCWTRFLTKTFRGVRLRSVRPHHVYSHMDKRIIEGATISANRERMVLGEMFKLAVRKGWVESNPVRDVVKSKERRRDRYLTDEEFWKIYNAAPRRLQHIMAVAYMTGLRVGDVLSLHKDQIEEGKPRVLLITQQKNKVVGRYVMTEMMEAIFEEAQSLKTVSGKGYIFENKSGGKQGYRHLNDLFTRTLAKVGLTGVHFHDIRSKAVTDADAEGRKPQEFSLHKSEAQADAYVKLKKVPSVVPLVMLVDKGLKV